MDSKRANTSGSRDDVYETKLLSLFYFRAVQDDTIEQFELCTNTKLVETFGGIRFKLTVKGHDKPGTVFVQILHKTNKQLKIDLAAYFDIYMKIKPIFDGTEWLFVIYTNATVDTQYIDASVRSSLSTKLNDILETGGMVKSPNNEENIKYLTKITVRNQITSLAKTIANCIENKLNFHNMMSNELVLRYHVILARKVLDVSDIPPQSENTPLYRIASFRQDFFDNTEEYIILFRDALYSVLIKRRNLKPTEIHLFLTELLDDPTDATRLSKLIGTFVTYNNGQLEFDDEYMPNIKPIDVPPATVKKAVELAAVEILSSTKFKVPAAFGNKDLTISGSDTEIENRICHLASAIKEQIDNCDASKIVTIDESLEDEFLELDGGIAGAIGNMFVLDDNTKFIKVTDNWESLNTLGQRLYRKLSDIIHNIHGYKFCFKVDKFPELTFVNYGEKKVRDFLNNFIIYCNQAAEENDVQEILKSEIQDVQRNQPNYFQIKSDTMFLMFQNEIQTWRLRQQVGLCYRSKNIDFFRGLIKTILFNSLISIISESYVNKLKQYDYTFTGYALLSLQLPNRPSSTIVVTENCILTVVKVLQHLRKYQKHYVLLDIEYLASLPVNDQNSLRAELENVNQKDVLILICDKIDFSHKKTFENIAHTVRNSSKIVILSQKSSDLRIYFPEADYIFNDKKFSLADVDIQSQKSILNDATAVFPGVEIRLGVFLRGWPRTGHATAAGGTATVADKNKADDRLLAPPFRSADIRIQSDDTQKQLISIGAWLSKSAEDAKSTAGGTADVANKDNVEKEPLHLGFLDQTLIRRIQEERERHDAAMSTAGGSADVDENSIIAIPPSRSTELQIPSDNTQKQFISIGAVLATEDEKSTAGGTADVANKDNVDEEPLLLEYLSDQMRRIQEDFERKESAMSTAGGSADVDENSIIAKRRKLLPTWIREKLEGQAAAMHKDMEDTGTLPDPNSMFNSRLFYKKFESADFLRSDENVERILARRHKLLEEVNLLEPGMTMIVDKMNLSPNTPLTIKKVGQNIEVGDFEFTYNRLIGLILAYVYENRHRFPKIRAMEAEELRLEWVQSNDEKCKLYLSAVSGSEYFTDQFSYRPLLCGLVKYKKNKLTVDEVLKMGHIKNANERTMAEVLKSNLTTALSIWSMIPCTTPWGLWSLMASPEFKKMFDD